MAKPQGNIGFLFVVTRPEYKVYKKIHLCSFLRLFCMNLRGVYIFISLLYLKNHILFHVVVSVPVVEKTSFSEVSLQGPFSIVAHTHCC